MEDQRRSSSSPLLGTTAATSLSDESTRTLRTPAASRGLLHLLFAGVVYLCVTSFFALASIMKTALYLCMFLARGSARLSRWVSPLRTISTTRRAFSQALSTPSVVVLRIVYAFLTIARAVFRKALKGVGKPEPKDNLEDKVDLLCQRLQVVRLRLEDVEALASSTKAPASPNLTQASLIQRTVLADRRRSYPEDYNTSLARMLDEARALTESAFCDSPNTDGGSSFVSSSDDGNNSMPPTPTLVPSRRISYTRHEKRRSTGLKPLLLPSILALDTSSTSPPSQSMFRTSWHDRPSSYYGAPFAISEMDEISRCETPLQDLHLGEGHTFGIAKETEYATTASEPPLVGDDTPDLFGLNFVTSDRDQTETLPTIPSKRHFSFIEP